MRRVLLCGPFPPPIGGVSIHIERLRSLLIKNDFSVCVCDESSLRKERIFNIRSLSLFRYLELVSGCSIVHIHSSVEIFRIVHIFFALLYRKRVIVTIHSWRSGRLKSLIWGSLLNKFADKVVLVSDELVTQLPIKTSKLVVHPAFLPPERSPSEIPEDVAEFIDNCRKAGKVILVSNAFRLAFYNNQDLYGLDLCIEAFEYEDCKDKAALVFVISDPEHNCEQINKYIESIRLKGLESNILIYCGSVDFVGLLRVADASIRATNTDGDALSVRESIYLGVPCISSDCVKRPNEAILFKNRSSISLASRILHAVQQEREIPCADEFNYFGIYKDVYLGD